MALFDIEYLQKTLQGWPRNAPEAEVFSVINVFIGGSLQYITSLAKLLLLWEFIGLVDLADVTTGYDQDVE